MLLCFSKIFITIYHINIVKKYNYIPYIILFSGIKNAPSKLVSTQCANKLPTESSWTKLNLTGT